MKHAFTLLAALLLPSLTVLQAAELPGVVGNVVIKSAVAMDRWLDIEWTFEGAAPSGFAVAVAANGRDYSVQEQVAGEARSASVFMDAPSSPSAKSDGMLSMRVAALGHDGRSGPWSAPATLRAGKARDIEGEIRKRFDYPVVGRPYKAEDPAYDVVYTARQKQSQRSAAKAMMVELEQAAKSSTAPRHFTIPPGIYRVGVGEIELKGVSDFSIHAPGVEIIVDAESKGAAFVFNACTNITLTGRPAGADGKEGSYLTFDSEQLPMSVARILAVDVPQRTLDVEILPGYSLDIPNRERMLAYDPAGHMINIRQLGWRGAASLGGRRFRLTSPSLRQPDCVQTVLKPGHLLALHINAEDGRATHAVYANRGCRNMSFASIRVYSGGGAPADQGTAGNTVYRDWRLLTRPGTSRLPVATGLGQFSKDGGDFVFEDCEFGPHLDDGINLLSGMSIAGRQNSATEVVVTGARPPTPGSTLTFYEYTNWVQCGAARVVASTRLEDTNTLAAVNAFALANGTRTKTYHDYRTLLDRPLRLSPFAMVVHSDYRADRIVVRGCLFRDQLAQIMVLQGARSGLIENNLLLRSTGAAISPQFSQYWWEGPMPANFMIRNNVIRDNPVAAAVTGFAGNGSIAVYAGTKYPSSARLLTNFRIEGNLIVNPSVYGIVVRNAEQVVIRHNRIVNPGACEVEGPYQGKPISELYAAICLDAVSHAAITDNEIVFGHRRCQRAVRMETNCDAATVRVERNREIHPTAPAANPAHK
ncbi:MAG: right-handed parallel beta-helix repeat-containing protein [Kiritimatiellaeota bacterium]|nr:right-handed parallel beta-helix repeat-containing protein [Kiritimatiellota bacterium]